MEPKAAQKTDPVWSILPSYDMYQNTFNGGQDPPQYGEAASVHESSYSPSYLSSDANTETTPATSYENRLNLDVADTVLSTSSPSLIVADESTHTWRETILDNIDNLRNYSSSDNSYTQNVELSVHFTEDVGQSGVVPKHIDPLQFEYKQGDYLNGYILIKNNCSFPLPFNMFYVLFEGNLTVTDKGHTPKKEKIKVRKYLEMYDFAASWNQSRIDRLLSEKNDGQTTCLGLIDPVDLAKLRIAGRELEPGVLYKRFFTFKIPERLLDTECNNHNLPSHTALPPTLGLSEKEKRLMGNLWETSNDFSFIDTSTNYSVLARFIGKASDFKVNDKFDLDTKLIDAAGDEFIIFRESRSFIRVVQESLVLSSAEKHMNAETARILYDNLFGRIQEKLELGAQMRKLLAEGKPVTNILPANNSIANSGDAVSNALKTRHLYTRLDDLSKRIDSEIIKPKDYLISIPIIKKRLLGAVKYQGMFQISSPKTDYILNYMSPRRFKNASENKNLWKLEAPIKISFQPADCLQGAKAPYISNIVPELVVFTMKAGKFPVPVEITHDHLFQNKSCKIVDFKLTDNFENIVQKPFKKFSLEFYSALKEIGSKDFKVEKSLLEDVCALAAVESKTNHLSLRNAFIIETDGSVKDLETQPAIEMESRDGIFCKEFSLVVDASKAQKKSPSTKNISADYSSVDEFCLVPSFQNCSLARMYYLRLLIKISTGEMIELKLPVTIAKIPSN
ncbi:hypothetical protein METBIDRAFT_44923 [Metschnikowia bicuspidata var. bicuspidata NRRL YB-4993]|uniref:Bul1 N-terminal domain-containing protein n=1 Tax=Metschnikowia bicuspidata var. bicuspidata NRRL YB-4993 TaxID=869754 RepID=A0A1A0H735_9ASCO|nr:hypothetical protein METBIDRAFT_44923 [Metschnikowia bicuspidata var. bicuspidata NRRL YB-4993]OBA19717.1 hypothetical protein METBIDRAFT_44923 [Metschnikowia bicuspidata var. bicuspidata NRRL YB-4993]